MNMNDTTMYIKDSAGNIRFWKIEALYWKGQIRISHGVVNGETQIQVEAVEEGRSNRSVNEQIDLRMKSRIKNKYDKGYRDSATEALKGRPDNNMGYKRPMLAGKFTLEKYVDLSEAYVQYKYDGHRCMITNDCGNLIAYSRNGKPITTIDHILREMDIPEGTTLDGELYIHGTKLQKIGSLVKKMQYESSLLRYHCYDIVENICFSDRAAMVRGLHLGTKAEFVPTWQAADFGINQQTIVSSIQTAKDQGYEGLMLRFDTSPYESGKRSRQILKAKMTTDDEFLVIGIGESKDEWAILLCVTGDGKQFSVSAPGTMPEKASVLRNRESYIGRTVRVEYAMLTADGIPFHPVALEWRDKFSE